MKGLFNGVLAFVLSASLMGAEEPVKILFDGKSLDGWVAVGLAKWRAEDGVLVGGQDGYPKRSGLIHTKDTFKDFDLSLEFMIDEHGKYNSGVYLRNTPGEKRRTGYQINLGRGAADEPVGLYLNEWLDKGDADDKVRKPMDWNLLRIRARGAHIEAWLNGVKIVDYSDPKPTKELLQAGTLAFQTYGAQGHSGWVKFRNITIQEL